MVLRLACFPVFRITSSCPTSHRSKPASKRQAAQCHSPERSCSHLQGCPTQPSPHRILSASEGKDQGAGARLDRRSRLQGSETHQTTQPPIHQPFLAALTLPRAARNSWQPGSRQSWTLMET